MTGVGPSPDKWWPSKRRRDTSILVSHVEEEAGSGGHEQADGRLKPGALQVPQPPEPTTPLFSSQAVACVVQLKPSETVCVSQY